MATELNPPLAEYVAARTAEFDQIDEDRKLALRSLARYIQTKADAGLPVRLTFICTHNSRRSHLSQLWGAVAAAHYGLADVQTFSGGTESTAFNPRAVAAVVRAGLLVDKGPEAENPRYQVRYVAGGPASECYSKVFHQAPNPSEDFCAVMTCTQADKNCPVVKGAEERIALPYDDPKVSDGTPQEAETYDERCRQIARELLYAFSQVRGK
ncbi:MAG: protein-tyrosine-phosphatase [Pirellulales bacterium]